MTISNKSIYDDYDITEIIGEGTFSTVTLASHRTTNENYAVKIIDKGFLNSQRREMVDWEISILTKCNHPHIVELIEHYESDEDICLVLEWVPSGDLFDRIVKKGVFNEDEARATMKSILSAVEYLHIRSIVHRDIKPENILFNSEDGDVKLADFGLSKYYEEAVGLDTACGTPVYSAPEINNNQIYRKGVDVWSCGCILYFILFGKPPFYSDDEEQIYQLVTQGRWEFPTNVVVSDQVKDMIKRLLEQDPSKRLTVQDALDHPWIVNSSSQDMPSTPNLTATATMTTPSPLISSSSSSTHSSTLTSPLVISSSSSLSSIRTSCNTVPIHVQSNNPVHIQSPLPSSLVQSVAPDLHIIETLLHQQYQQYPSNYNNHSIRSSLQRSFDYDTTDYNNDPSTDQITTMPRTPRNSSNCNFSNPTSPTKLTLRSSYQPTTSAPIPIRDRLRTSLNSSIDFARGPLTPPFFSPTMTIQEK